MDNLNEQQKYAATFEGKHLLVLAGAGTGKTRTIIARAKYLIKSGVQPKRILILSFTRKSAQEIVERIQNELPDTVSEGLTGSTFHSWCIGIIKNHPKVFPQANYTLLDEEDQNSCFRLICGKRWALRSDKGKKISPDEIKDTYSYMVNAKCSLSKAIRMKIFDNAPEDFDIQDLSQIFKEIIEGYLEFKQTRNYIDYDDILLIVSKYLKRNEELRKLIASRYDHILIDEMQDTNPLQYELLSSFYELCHLFCVGDDAQSIYGFRGADFKTIHQFTKIVKDSEVCKLTINYRSTQEILDLSNWIINQSPLNYDKELSSFRGKGQIPEIIHWGDEWEQANNIGNYIIDAIKKKNKKYKDNLVLSRSIWGIRKLESVFIKYKIPYRVYGGIGLFASKHIRDLVSALRIVNNYYDEIAWTRYLELWPNVGPITSSQILSEVLKEKSLEDCLLKLIEIINSKQLSESIYNSLIQISNLQDKPTKAIQEAYKIMEPRLEEIYKNNNWNTRKNDFPILEDVAKSTGSINEFISEYILDPMLNTTLKLDGKLKDMVIISTIHSAKGLEADIVYLIDASTHAYPTQRAIANGEDAIEEERRCLYVALTRAKDELRIYRDVHSIHINSEEDQNYFLNKLPGELYKPEIIASHYYYQDRSNQGQQIQEDIYSDLDLS